MPLHGRNDAAAILGGWRHWFFQQHVIAAFGERNGRFGVHGVLGGDDDRICHLGSFCRFAPIIKNKLRRDLVCLHEALTEELARLGHADHLEPIWLFQCKRAIVRSTSAGPNAKESDFLHEAVNN